MIFESIKTLLGDALTAQVETALKGKGKDGKDVDLVVGNDGTFVPADKYEGEKRRATSAENALKKAAEAVKDLGGSGDPTKLEEDAGKAKTTIETLKTEHKKEIAGIRKDTALRMALSGKVHDPADVIGLLDASKIEVGEDGALKTDLEALLKPIQESKPYLFKSAEPAPNPNLSGAKPAPETPGASAKQPTMEEIEKMSMEEYAAYRAKQDGFPRN